MALASSRAAYEAAQKRVERAEMALKTAQSIARSGETSADAVQVSLQRSFGTEEGKLEGNLDIATEDKVDVEVRDVNAEAALETVEVQEKGITSNDQIDATILQCEKEIEAAFAALKEKEAEYSKCEEELSQTQFLKMEILEKAALLSETFENARIAAAAADSEVAIAMSLAEESVAMEVEATQRVSDGEIALQKAEGSKKDAVQAASALAAVDIAEKLSLQVAKTAEVLLLETELKQEDDGKQDRIEAEVEEKVVTFFAFFIFYLFLFYFCLFLFCFLFSFFRYVQCSRLDLFRWVMTIHWIPGYLHSGVHPSGTLDLPCIRVVVLPAQ